jgi:hypothetical protein
VTSLVVGRAYQRRATLELAGEMLTWRAQRGDVEPIAENIVTTISDVRDVRWIERRWSVGGLAIAVFAGLWTASEDPYVGSALFALAAAMIAYRLARPQRWLVIELDGHRLALHVSPDAAPGARELAQSIESLRHTGTARALPLP